MSDPAQPERDSGLARLLVGDGRPLLAVSGLILILAGVFAVFVAARGEFLPHDIAFLGMTAQDLCALHECRIVHFMIHDRVAFGGALIAAGILYLWLAVGPLARGEWWAWELLSASGLVGFTSFLTFFGFGYFDIWHATATSLLAILFSLGLIVCWQWLPWQTSTGRWFAKPIWLRSPRDRRWFGRLLLLFAASGMVVGGLTIAMIGMTLVFVPEDVAYMGVGRAELESINPRLVPLIAHDRAGFGGAVCSCGVALFGIAWRARLERSCRQSLALAGFAGFSTAIFVHPAIGYDNWWHLVPAIAGGAVFALGCWLTRESR